MERKKFLVILGLIFFVGATVHSPKHNNRDEFTEDDSKKVFPDKFEDTLLLVNVLFRHGNRTADSKAELYPKDPYLNYTYFPYGLGQLTWAGKNREYAIGKALRERYADFLGDYYYPEIVEAQSTDYNRTKMSLLLVLAGLFPPKPEDMLIPGMLWQPIPFNSLPRNEDRILLGVLCPKYVELYNQFTASSTVQNTFRSFRKLFDYITEHSGLNITRFQDIYQMYFGVSTEAEYGLKLPRWLDTVWPHDIIEASIFEYYVAMGTPDLRKMAIGYFLEKVIEDAKNKISRTTKLGRKIHLYSGHENNVAELLIALGVFEPHIPNYGAYVILELHKIDNRYGFKIFYDNWTGSGPQPLKMPKCHTFCPLDIFILLIEEDLPNDPHLCGN